MPYVFKQDKQHVKITIKGKGNLDKKNIATPYGQLLAKDILENYPQWAHNIELISERKVNEPTKIPFDLKKNEASSLTSEKVPTDGENLSSNGQEPKSELTESKPKPEPEKENLAEKKLVVSVPTKKQSKKQKKKG